MGGSEGIREESEEKRERGKESGWMDRREGGGREAIRKNGGKEKNVG